MNERARERERQYFKEPRLLPIVVILVQAKVIKVLSEFPPHLCY